ncbi:MAG: pilus assembly protein Flp/PilA [Cognaticolwellia sp.]|jgi:pilus assembly protein Flp/PilA
MSPDGLLCRGLFATVNASKGTALTQASPERNQSSRIAAQEFKMIKAFINDESGATAIEYGLIAGLVAVAIIAALTALGGSLDTLFSNVASTVNTAAS